MTFCPVCKQYVPGEPVFDKIVKVVSKTTGVSLAAILGMSRVPEYTRARSMAMLLFHEMSGFGPEQISKYFSRDRVTIYCALKRAKFWRDKDPSYRAVLNKVKKELA